MTRLSHELDITKVSVVALVTRPLGQSFVTAFCNEAHLAKSNDPSHKPLYSVHYWGMPLSSLCINISLVTYMLYQHDSNTSANAVPQEEGRH
jgi:hypothetical protein